MDMEFLTHANDELRRLIRDLRPMHLAAGDLAEAVRWLVEEVQAAGGPNIELRCDIQPDRIPPCLELTAFHVVRESLANACYHGRSNRILLSITQNDELLRIQMEDGTMARAPRRIPRGRAGIDGIHRRIPMLHGVVSIRSKRGDGTFVSVELPLNR